MLLNIILIIFFFAEIAVLHPVGKFCKLISRFQLIADQRVILNFDPEWLGWEEGEGGTVDLEEMASANQGVDINNTVAIKVPTWQSDLT